MWNVIEASISENVDKTQYFLPETMKIKNIEFKIELIKCTHTIATTGYGFIELRSKLKSEYIGLSQTDIDNIKLTGITITDIIQVPHFCYLGDTDHNVLYVDKECTLFSPHIEKYKNILIECTFLYDEDSVTAKKNGHMLWKNLRSYIEMHPDNNFILYHFSMKYKSHEIIDFFELPENKFSNVNILIHNFHELFLNYIDKVLQNESAKCDTVLKKYLTDRFSEIFKVYDGKEEKEGEECGCEKEEKCDTY